MNRAQQLANYLEPPPTLPPWIVDHSRLLAKELAKELKRLVEPHHDQLLPVKLDPDVLLSCSFCGSAENEVQYLIDRPPARICDACARVCQGIILEQNDFAWLQHYAHIARSLAVDVKKASAIPGAISDRASLLAVELERIATSAKPG